MIAAQQLRDGDARFVGVDELTDPGSLLPGYVASARNKRFDTGEAADRPGIIIRPIGPSADGLTPYDNPQGAIVFRDPDTLQQWFLIAHNGTVKACGTHQTGTSVALPSGTDWGTDAQTEIEFTQAFGQVYLWRAGAAPLVLDTFGTGFETVTQSTSGSGNGTGTLTIPNATRAEFIQNRIFAVFGDNLYVSDAQNGSRYSLLNAFRINDGSDDTLLTVKQFTGATAVAFKTKSVHWLTNLVADSNGDFSNASRQLITRQHGLVSPWAVAQAGRDLFYFSTDGLTSIGLTEENNVKATDVPLSRPMRALWKRINWQAAERSQLAYWDSKLYWAVPVDSSPVPNVVAVYDFRMQAWAGIDDGDALVFGVKRFLPAFYSNQLRLFFLDWNGNVRLYEEGYHDQRQGDFKLNEDGNRQLSEFGLPQLTEDLDIYQMDVDGELTTRGYTCGSVARKKFHKARCTVATWNPTLTVSSVQDGINEVTAHVTEQTRSRTRYTTLGTDDWDPSNTNDDHGEPYREDYSTVLGNGMYLGSGLYLDAHQTWSENLWLSQRGRHAQLRVRSTTGRATLRSIEVTASPSDQSLQPQT